MSQSSAPVTPTVAYPPVGKRLDINDEEFTYEYPTAHQRLSAYIGDVYGYNEEGNWNLAEVTDPFMLDLITLIKQAGEGIGSVEITAMGAYASCEHEAKYAGNQVSDGNRIYTPQEAALKTLQRINALDSK